MKVYIVGAGPGDEQSLTGRARDIITGADQVIATGRLYERFRHLNANITSLPLDGLAEAVLSQDKRAVGTLAVLVSGDYGFFSAARRLLPSLKGLHTECISGISSLQYLCARLNASYDDVKCVSLHGRGGTIVPHVCYNPKVFALTGGERKARAILAELAGAGLGGVLVSVGENLSSPEERILTDHAENLLDEQFSDLSVLLIQNPDWADRHAALDDSDFIRGNIPMTKRAVRRLAIDALGIRPGDIVADIGAGTGAVSVELARKAHEGRVYALEKKAEAVELIRQNREKFKTYNLTIRHAAAPEGLDALPRPNAAFIGGSDGTLGEIAARLLALSPGIRLAVAAVTLETLHEGVGVFAGAGLSPEIQCVNVAVACKAGKYNLMRAENPVYIISGAGPDR